MVESLRGKGGSFFRDKRRKQVKQICIKKSVFPAIWSQESQKTNNNKQTNPTSAYVHFFLQYCPWDIVPLSPDLFRQSFVPFLFCFLCIPPELVHSIKCHLPSNVTYMLHSLDSPPPPGPRTPPPPTCRSPLGIQCNDEYLCVRQYEKPFVDIIHESQKTTNCYYWQMNEKPSSINALLL